MVQIDLAYEGSLRCRARHAPSGTELTTDAPVDNHGRGESFSPTDLVATALGTCILTTIAIVAERRGWDLAGSTARVEKRMVADPARRIGELSVVVHLAGTFDAEQRKLLVQTAHACPVHKTLSSSTAIPIEFVWDDADRA